jgi:hypothetical protein
MRCEQKRQIIEERSQRLLQHAFVITGKDDGHIGTVETRMS